MNAENVLLDCHMRDCEIWKFTSTDEHYQIGIRFKSVFNMLFKNLLNRTNIANINQLKKTTKNQTKYKKR